MPYAAGMSNADDHNHMNLDTLQGIHIVLQYATSGGGLQSSVHHSAQSLLVRVFCLDARPQAGQPVGPCSLVRL